GKCACTPPPSPDVPAANSNPLLIFVCACLLTILRAFRNATSCSATSSPKLSSRNSSAPALRCVLPLTDANNCSREVFLPVAQSRLTVLLGLLFLGSGLA